MIYFLNFPPFSTSNAQSTEEPLKQQNYADKNSVQRFFLNSNNNFFLNSEICEFTFDILRN